VVTDGLVAIIEPLIDRKYIAMSTIKKNTDYRNIRMRSRQKQKKLIKVSLTTAQKNVSTIALRNGSSNILLSAKKKITKI
jgi:hypothetical protein